MKKILYSLVLALFLTSNVNSLPSVAFCGWDGSSGDKFSFVLLRDFTAGEVIYFTEEDYSDASNSFGVGEGHLAYTVPAGGLFENEVISITESSTNTYTVGCAGGTAVHVAGTGSWSFSNADELYAYSASNAASPYNSITEMHCFAFFQVVSIPANQNPSANWPNTIIISFTIGGSGGMNADFLVPARINTTVSDLQNGANWAQSTGAISLSCIDFTNHLLPIELVSFDSRVRGSEVLLEWITDSEINNERFEIEYSTDGKNFSRIGTVDGNGTSNKTNLYQMVHSTPTFGMNYYRLKQVDYDGAFTYSSVIVENIQYVRTTTSAFPNPFHNSLTLQFDSSEAGYTGNVRTIEVYDVYGKLALKTEVPFENTKITLNLSQLNSGTYFVQTLDSQFPLSKIQRVIKL